MKSLLFKSAVLAAVFALLGCGTNDIAENDIKWSDDNGGTLEVVNGSGKDIVVFHGQSLTESGLMGGVKAGSTKLFDVSKFSDFNTGGYVVLKGMSRDEYNAHRFGDLSEARIEFRAMATYRRGSMYRIHIDLTGGDYGFKINNTLNVGVELRRNSPDGEKVTYLGPLESNQIIYFSTTTTTRLFPVYVYYNKTTGEVSTLKTTDLYQTINVAARPLAGATSMNSYNVPGNTSAWDYIKGTVKFPYAYVKVRNNIDEQETAILKLGGVTQLMSQSGYDGIIPGESLVFEVEGSDMPEGAATSLNIELFSRIHIPVLIEEEVDVATGEVDENGEPITVKEKIFSQPKLKNGYDYEVIVSGSGEDASGYRTTITESANKRDISTVIGTH
jgi:hypothetical protein